MPPQSDWYKSDDPNQFARGLFGFSLKWTIAVIAAVLVLVVIIGALVTGFNTGTASIRGKAGAYQQKESTVNRVFAQAYFQDLNATVTKDVANITLARQAIKADPSAYNKANLIGVQQVCNTDVAEYNASAGKYLLQQFKDASLPSSYDLGACNPTP